jgi:hypothetical protein
VSKGRSCLRFGEVYCLYTHDQAVQERPWIWDTKFLRNVGNSLPTDTASHSGQIQILINTSVITSCYYPNNGNCWDFNSGSEGLLRRFVVTESRSGWIMKELRGSISDFRLDVEEIFALLGCYAA